MNNTDRLLRDFGSVMQSYSGSGALRFNSGTQVPADFSAGQLDVGTNVLVCAIGDHDCGAAFNDIFSSAPAAGFEGQAGGGVSVEADGLDPVDLPGGMPEGAGSTCFAAYRPRVLRVRWRTGIPSQVRYGLVNPRPPGRPNLRLRLQSPERSIDPLLSRKPDYHRIFERVRITRSTAVTCELVFTDTHVPEAVTRQVTDDVCYLLSIAQGCKVQWVYREDHDASGLLCREHFMRKTQPHGPLAVIDLKTLTGPKRFLETTYPSYVMRRDSWKLDAGTIDAYLEAKAEADFLETRGAKLAVALEAIKHRYLRSGEASLSEFVLVPERFEHLEVELRAVLRTVLSRHGVGAQTARTISDKTGALNRTSFRSILGGVTRDLDIKLTSGERGQFVDSRNTLVHQGQFYYQAVAKMEADGTSKPLGSPAAEYLFMVNVLDRIVLKLVGYSGEYINWTRPAEPRTEQLR